jgi:5-formyltetrahydrofolate cyclo-ligase
VLDEKLPVLTHDIPVDYVVTPTKVIQTHTKLPRPTGIYWEYLTKEKLDGIPYLKQYRQGEM